MEETRPNLCSQYIRIFIVVSCYWIISIVTVFVNKSILLRGMPVFITWFQCFVSFIICWLLSVCGGIPRVFKFPKGSPWSIDVIIKVIPVSVIFALMVASNNLCLRYVSVPFYDIGRSLTTVFNVALSWLLLGQRTSYKCIAVCLCIMFGFCLGVDQENLYETFSIRGTIYGVISSLMIALYSIYMKKVLTHVNQDVWLLSYYNNAYAILLLFPLIFAFQETTELLNNDHFNSVNFWMMMIGSGICGLAIGYITSLQIKVTSPLTHNISGTAKACTQTIIATQWDKTPKSVLWWTSSGVILASSVLYAWFKQQEMGKKSKQEIDEKSIEEMEEKSQQPTTEAENTLV